METTVIASLNRIRDELLRGDISTGSELANALRSALTVEASNIKLPRFVPSEPPSTYKYNGIVDDVNKLLSERDYVFDLLLAASLYDYDTGMRMLDDLENKVMGLVDSIKTLYFFSKPPRAGVHIVGSDFRVGKGVFINPTNTLVRLENAGLTLPIIKAECNKVRPIVKGDGIPGVYYMIDSQGNLQSSALECSDEDYISDNNPTTWFEMQRFKVTPAIMGVTKGYGFGFGNTDIKWASDSYNDVSMSVKMIYPAPISANYISIIPADHATEFMVKNITLSLNGDVVKTVPTNNLVINQQLMMHSQEGYANGGFFSFEPTKCDTVELKFSNNKSVPCRIRHHYRLDTDNNRIATESPTLSDPEYLIRTPLDTARDKTEDFAAERFAIAIKDISVQELTYGTDGFAITEPVAFNKPIDRVAFVVDADVPTGCFVNYMVSLDQENWFSIEPLGTSMRNQVIAINDMIPTAYQDPSTRYISAEGEPNMMYARIYMERGRGVQYVTPLIRSLEIETTLKP